MVWFAAAVGSALVFGLAGLFMKVSQMRGGELQSLLLGLYAAGACGFWAQAVWTGVWTPGDWRIWLGGAVIGLGSAWGNLLFMRALDYGPASLTSPLTNSNIALVALMGIFVYGEPVHAAAIAGVALLLAAAGLLSVRGRVSFSISDPHWYTLVPAATLLFALRNGGLKVTGDAGLDNTSVLWAGYLLSLLWLAASAWRTRRTPPGPAAGRARAVGWRWGLLAGLCSWGGLQLYADALASGPSHLVAPIFATNSLVIVLGSLVFYRERLSWLQSLALLLLCAGLVLVRL